MPERPEVETVRRGLQPAMEGARFRQGRGAPPRSALAPAQGFRRAARRADRRGPRPRRAKYLLADLSSGDVLLMHLACPARSACSTAAARKAPPKRPAKYHHERSQHLFHDHVVFHMATVIVSVQRSPSLWLDEDTRAQARQEPLLRALGPEPARHEFDPGMLARACKGKKKVAQGGTVDQKIVAGARNIYVCEALHRAASRPSGWPRRSPANQACRTSARKIVDAIRAVLADAIAPRRLSLRDQPPHDGEIGLFQHIPRLRPRGRRRAHACCSGTIKRIVQTGRRRSSVRCARNNWA